MSGNTWEWVEDHWDDNYKGAPKDSSAWLSKDKGASRVLRGGSCFDVPRGCRSAYRLGIARDYRDVDFGFRLALSPVPAIL